MRELCILVPPFKDAATHFLKDILPAGTPITPGDTKVIWNAANVDEVQAAKATFDKLVAKGYTAFRAEGKEGTKGGKLTAFDSEAERMILIPKVAGG